MFCDLVDSTGIAARLDAEEWRDLVGAYLEAASAAVAEIGAKVAKKLGDGLMALFGYPRATASPSISTTPAMARSSTSTPAHSAARASLRSGWDPRIAPGAPIAV